MDPTFFKDVRDVVSASIDLLEHLAEYHESIYTSVAKLEEFKKEGKYPIPTIRKITNMGKATYKLEDIIGKIVGELELDSNVE